MFSPSLDQTEKKLPPVIVWEKKKAVYIPLDVGLTIFSIAALLWRIKHRKKAHEQHLSAGKVAGEAGK